MPRAKSKSKETNRTDHIVVRVTPGEKQFIIELAKNQKTSAADYVRGIFFDPDTKRSLEQVKSEVIAAKVAAILESEPEKKVKSKFHTPGKNPESEEAKNDDTD